MLVMLYGRDNILSEDISIYSTQKQSEKTRHGTNCVELPDSLGDGSKSSIKKIKAFITEGREWIGRDAYGRNENTRPVKRTYVIWHTGNEFRFLEDETGNRRFIPMPVQEPISEPWLRDNCEQLWAEVVELEKRGRSDYYTEHPEVLRGEEIFPDIFLPEEFWEEAAELQRAHMKEGAVPISYESMLRKSYKSAVCH